KNAQHDGLQSRDHFVSLRTEEPPCRTECATPKLAHQELRNRLVARLARGFEKPFKGINSQQIYPLALYRKHGRPVVFEPLIGGIVKAAAALLHIVVWARDATPRRRIEVESLYVSR